MAVRRSGEIKRGYPSGNRRRSPPAEMLEMLEMSWFGGNGDLQYFCGGNKHPTPRDAHSKVIQAHFTFPARVKVFNLEEYCRAW
jgi:hypothetical protein